jgi:hypothetical protein
MKMTSTPMLSAFENLIENGATAAGAALVVSMSNFRPGNGALAMPRAGGLYRDDVQSVVDGSKISIGNFEIMVASGRDLADVLASLGMRDPSVAALGKILGERVARGGQFDQPTSDMNVYLIELLMAAGYASEADAAEWIAAFGGTGQLLSDDLAAKFAAARAGGEPVHPSEVLKLCPGDLSVRAAAVALGYHYVGELAAWIPKHAASYRRAKLDALLTSALEANRAGHFTQAMSSLRGAVNYEFAEYNYPEVEIIMLDIKHQNIVKELDTFMQFINNEHRSARSLIKAQYAPVAPVAQVVPVETPVAAPVAEADTPVAQVAAPVAQTAAPVSQVEAPVAQTAAPVAEIAAPAAQTAAQTAVTETPVASVESPTQDSVTETPVAACATPVAQAEAPVARVAEMLDRLTRELDAIAGQPAVAPATLIMVAELRRSLELVRAIESTKKC